MGSCCSGVENPLSNSDLSSDQKGSTTSSIVKDFIINPEKEIEFDKKLPKFTEQLSTQMNIGFIQLLNNQYQKHHLPCFLVTAYHGLVYIPQSDFTQQCTYFTIEKLYIYQSISSSLTENPIKQIIILPNKLDDRVEILQPVEFKRVNKSSIIMVRFQNKATINRNINITDSQNISESGQVCCLKKNSPQEGVKKKMLSINYKFKTNYRSDIFAQESNINNGREQLQNSPNSKDIFLTPQVKTDKLAPGPIFSYLPNKTYSFLGFYSGKSKQIQQLKYFNMLCISSQLSSIIRTLSYRGFIVNLNLSSHPTIQTSINSFLSIKSSQYSKFHPQFRNYQHYRVNAGEIKCDELDSSKDLQLHKCLISKNGLPYLKGAKYSLKIQLLKHCTDMNGLITIAFKEQKQFLKNDDKSTFFSNRMYIRIIKINNVLLETQIGINNESFNFITREQIDFVIRQQDYLTFYLDMEQKKLTCIIKKYAEDVFRQSEQVRAFSFHFPRELYSKSIQLYFQTNKGGQQFRIL